MRNITNFLTGIKKLIQLIENRNNELVLIVFLIFFNAFVELIAISLVQPLTLLASGGEFINFKDNSFLVNKLFYIFNISSLNIFELGLLVIVVLSVSFFTTIFLQYKSIYLSVNLRKDWTKKILSDLLKSPYVDTSQERTGKIVETISNETKLGGEVILYLIQLTENFLLSVFLVIGLLISNFYPTIGLILISSLVLLLLKKLGIFKSVERGRKLVKYNQSISSIITESILNIKQIKLFNAYKFPLGRIDSDLKSYGKYRVAFGVSKGIPSPFFRYLFISGGVITLMILSSSDNTKITNLLPNITLLAVLAGRLSAVFSTLSKQTMKFNQGLANVESVHRRIWSNKEIEDLENGLNINQKIIKINFENVSFSWPNNKLLFKDLNICFERGVNVITGPSGCGKSTIASLLLALLKVDSGEIKINDENINIFNKNDLRSKIAYITQDNELFQGTFFENIRLGDPLAKKEDIIRAGKLSLSHNFIMSTDSGYETKLTERGGTLSGGQKQRLSIARSLLKNHDVYIFDEATNALDATNESLIQNTISKLGKNNIVIQISHIPSSIRKADKIFEFHKNGKISERIGKDKK